THYPFDEQVRLSVSPPKPVRFPLYLRVPGWCGAPAVLLNGQAVEVPARSGVFLVLDRTWNAGDRLELMLPMKVALRTWKKNHDSVSVDRGPLTYSLRIGEKYVRTGGTERWPSHEIHPTTPWNYGLVLSSPDPAASFEVVRREWPKSDQPFTHEG